LASLKELGILKGLLASLKGAWHLYRELGIFKRELGIFKGSLASLKGAWHL
jgi:hypothetical protein